MTEEELQIANEERVRVRKKDEIIDPKLAGKKPPPKGKEAPPPKGAKG